MHILNSQSRTTAFPPRRTFPGSRWKESPKASALPLPNKRSHLRLRRRFLPQPRLLTGLPAMATPPAEMRSKLVMAASMKRVGADTEKLTRRNMKECVAEYIQTKCIEDPAFARLAMHPLKSMIHCFWYINRKAREYLQEEMKMNDEQPPQGVNGVYGGDVPDDLCYSWAEEYFRDPDAEEDHRDEEKFVPKPYIGASSKGKTTSKAKPTDKKQAEKKSSEKPQDKPKPKEDDGQMSLLGVA